MKFKDTLKKLLTSARADEEDSCSIIDLSGFLCDGNTTAGESNPEIGIAENGSLENSPSTMECALNGSSVQDEPYNPHIVYQYCSIPESHSVYTTIPDGYTVNKNDLELLKKIQNGCELDQGELREMLERMHVIKFFCDPTTIEAAFLFGQIPRVEEYLGQFEQPIVEA